MIPSDASAEPSQPVCTPAYENGFGPNTDKLHHLLIFIGKGVAGYSAETSKIQTKITKMGTDDRDALVAEAKKLLQALTKHTTEFAGGIQTIKSLVPVLTVTIVEAYLKDVLIYAAGIDKTLMERSEQMASYRNVCTAESLEALINELRGDWAQNFLDRGGPKAWIGGLERMGAVGYGSATLPMLETLWGIRHLMVHSAGVVTPEFVLRHPSFLLKCGDQFVVRNSDLKDWFAAIFHFVDVTDRYFVRRCRIEALPTT